MQSQAIRRSNYTETEIIRIAGLQGQASADALSAALGSLQGVRDVSVSLDTEKATVLYEPEQVSRELLRRAVATAGYEALKPVHGEDGVCCGGCGG